jgi:hypothetical protein
MMWRHFTRRVGKLTKQALCALYSHDEFFIPKVSTADHSRIAPHVFCSHCGADCSSWFHVTDGVHEIHITNNSDLPARFVSPLDDSGITIYPGDSAVYFAGMYLNPSEIPK